MKFKCYSCSSPTDVEHSLCDSCKRQAQEQSDRDKRRKQQDEDTRQNLMNATIIAASSILNG